MAKAIMAHVAHTGSITDQVIKMLPNEFIYGSDNDVPASFEAVVEYVLSEQADDLNPALEGEMAQTAQRLRSLYDRGRSDRNVMIALAGITRAGDLIQLPLDGQVEQYLGDSDRSLLRARSEHISGLKQEYDALELRLDDQSKGGYDTHLLR